MTDTPPTFVPFEAQQVFIDKALRGALTGEYLLGGYGGGIRGGKTWALLGTGIMLLKMFPGSRAVVVRQDLPTLRRNTVPSIQRLRPTCSNFLGELNHTTWTYPCANGSELLLFSESRDIDPDFDRWKGLEANFFLLEEANELSEKARDKAIERAGSLVLRGRGVSQPHPLVLCSFNPAPGWVRNTFFDPWRQGTLDPHVFYQPALMVDNPFIPESYQESVKRLPPDEYRRFVEGDWDTVSGRFLSELSRATHIPPQHRVEPSPWWECWGSYDWGFRHNACFTFWAKDTDGQITALDTVWMHRLSDVEQAQEILHRASRLGVAGRMALTEVYAGHDAWHVRQAHAAGIPTTADVFASHGIMLAKATIDRVAGWGAVRQGLAATRRDPETGAITPVTPRLRFCDTPGNQRVFDQLLALVPDKNKPEAAAKADADDLGRGGDDGADAFRYGAAAPVAGLLAGTPGIPAKFPTAERAAQAAILAQRDPEIAVGPLAGSTLRDGVSVKPDELPVTPDLSRTVGGALGYTYPSQGEAPPDWNRGAGEQFPADW